MAHDTEKIIIEKLKKFTSKKFNKESNIFEIGIDSLDLVEMITELEEFFSISISDEELLKIKTIQDIITIVDSQK